MPCLSLYYPKTRTSRCFVTVIEQTRKMLGNKLQGFCGFNTFSLDLVKDKGH